MFRPPILICLILSLIGCDKALEEANTELGFFEPPFVHTMSLLSKEFRRQTKRLPSLSAL